MCTLALVSIISVLLCGLPDIAFGQAHFLCKHSHKEEEVYGTQVDQGSVADCTQWVDPESDSVVDLPDETSEPSAAELDGVFLPISREPMRSFSFDDWCDGRSDERLVGIDVSEWSGTVDWDTVKDKVDFAILRIGGTYEQSESLYEDEQFKRNVQECERLGIPYGVYFYSTAINAWNAAVEAEYVCDQLKGCNPTLPVFLDLEWEKLDDPSTGVLLTKIASTFCGRVASAGWKPGVYASLSWWENYLTDPAFDDWAKWVAQFGESCDVSCNCWQYDHEGSIEGVEGSVDLNYWYPNANQ